MIRKFFFIASLFGLLAGCASKVDAVPTPYPSDYIPTVVMLTGQAAYATASALTASVTNTPTEAPRPASTDLSSTPLPTLTPTPEPGFTDFALLHFLSPGPMSKIVSPLELKMLVTSGESEIVKIDLFGEDGRLLYSKLESVSHDIAGIYRFYKIPFEIRAVAENGWIQVSTKDKQGRLQALNTLQVLLFSAGTNEINPPGNIIYERCMLETPAIGAAISGGVLTVKGRMWPFNAQPVFVDLVPADGRPIGTRVLTFKGVEPQSFETTVPYKVSGLTQALLTIRQVDPVLNMPVYIYTREVILNP